RVRAGVVVRVGVAVRAVARGLAGAAEHGGAGSGGRGDGGGVGGGDCALLGRARAGGGGHNQRQHKRTRDADPNPGPLGGWGGAGGGPGAPARPTRDEPAEILTLFSSEFVSCRRLVLAWSAMANGDVWISEPVRQVRRLYGDLVGPSALARTRYEQVQVLADR